MLYRKHNLSKINRARLPRKDRARTNPHRTRKYGIRVRKPNRFEGSRARTKTHRARNKPHRARTNSHRARLPRKDRARKKPHRARKYGIHVRKPSRFEGSSARKNPHCTRNKTHRTRKQMHHARLPRKDRARIRARIRARKKLYRARKYGICVRKPSRSEGSSRAYFAYVYAN